MLEGSRMFVIIYKSKKTGTEYMYKSVGKSKEEVENKFKNEYGIYYDIIKVFSYRIGK